MKENKKIDLKEVITGEVKYDGMSYVFDENMNMILQVRGWGFIQKLDNPEEKQDALGVFIADAINEKLQRGKGYE